MGRENQCDDRHRRLERQAQYYQWRDQFLAHAPKASEVHEQSQREARLARENAKFKTLVGELTLELKKATRCSDEPTAISLAGQRSAALVQRSRALGAEHLFWGSRRMRACFRLVEQLPVNKKRIRRLMREHELLVSLTCS
ncbi:MAG TPA: IS3 family transposase [Candidatus Tectomicrobia bacterium]|nr:IS3 family transposase [Candidatus Tectomicrobia bacterium]